MKPLLLMGTFFLSISCNLFDKKNQNFVSERETQIVGTYILDTVHSDFADISDIDSKWEVVFTPDKKFFFSKSLPFIIDSVGKWQYIFEDDIAYLQLHFRNSSVEQQVLTDGNRLIMKSPQPRVNSAFLKELVLIKKN